MLPQKLKGWVSRAKRQQVGEGGPTERMMREGKGDDDCCHCPFIHCSPPQPLTHPFTPHHFVTPRLPLPLPLPHHKKSSCPCIYTPPLPSPLLQAVELWWGGGREEPERAAASCSSSRLLGPASFTDDDGFGEGGSGAQLGAGLRCGSPPLAARPHACFYVLVFAFLPRAAPALALVSHLRLRCWYFALSFSGSWEKFGVLHSFVVDQNGLRRKNGVFPVLHSAGDFRLLCVC